MKMTEELLYELADEYCTNHTPISELAKKSGVSKTTIIRYFSGEGSFKLNSAIQAQVDIVKQSNWIEGKSTSGNLGNTKLTNEEIVKLAEYMVNSGLTLEELTGPDSPVKSTIFGYFTEANLGSELYQKVLRQYGNNKRDSFNEYNSRKGKK